MSGTGNGEKVLLVAAPYYVEIVEDLARGAAQVLTDAGYGVDRVDAPGAFEIPAVIAEAARLSRWVGYVALGCVIRGETSHYDHICTEVSRGVMDLSVRDRLSIGFGVLTVENEAQARERASPDHRNKGGEAARAALAMIALRQRVAQGRA